MITEKQFLGQVLDLALLYGWKVHHVFEQRQYARRTDKGFPDLVLVRGERLIFAELKSEKGKQTTDQEAWLAALEETGAKVFLWRPNEIEKIEEILRPEDGNNRWR